MSMSYLQIMTDLTMIDRARVELAKEENQGNPLQDMLEVMTDMAERHMRPKPKPRTIWDQIWDWFDKILHRDKYEGKSND